MPPPSNECPSACDGQTFTTTPEDYVLSFIDGTLDNITRELVNPDGRPSITLKRRSNQGTQFLNLQTGALEFESSNIVSTYSWPGKNTQEAWQFRSLNIYRKRDIYYTDPICFRSQKVVDILVDDIAYTIGVDRRALHVAAAAKGLVAGCCQILLKNQTLIDIDSFPDGILIPRMEDVETISFPEVKWVLVVEKEAVFRRLVTKSYHKASAMGKGILITGKGYPDLCTRALLRLLSENLPQISSPSDPYAPFSPPPIFTLVDSDPDGMAIMSIFKYGSVAQAHENAKLNVRELQWLGLRTSNVVAGSDGIGEQSFLPLSSRDRKKAVAMLNSPSFAEDSPEPTWRAELQQMLMLNLKAEIELLYDRDGGLEGWLDKQMQEIA